MTGEPNDAQIQKLAVELRQQIQTLEARYDAATTDDERDVIAQEATDLMTRTLIKHMVGKVSEQLLAVLGVEHLAQYFGDGMVWPSGGFIRGGRLSVPMGGSEFVVPKP